MEKGNITILELPGALGWGLFTISTQPSTFYRFRLEGDGVIVEKQAYMQQPNGTHYLGNIGDRLYRTLTESLKEELKQKGIVEQS